MIGGIVGLSTAILLAGKMGGSTISATAISAKVLQPTLQQGAKSEGSFSIVDESAQLDEATVLQTDGSGFAELTYGDGSLSRIGENTTYEIAKSRVKGDTRDLRGQITKGKSWHNVKTEQRRQERVRSEGHRRHDHRQGHRVRGDVRDRERLLPHRRQGPGPRPRRPQAHG